MGFASKACRLSLPKQTWKPEKGPYNHYGPHRLPCLLGQLGIWAAHLEGLIRVLASHQVLQVSGIKTPGVLAPMLGVKDLDSSFVTSSTK